MNRTKPNNGVTPPPSSPQSNRALKHLQRVFKKKNPFVLSSSWIWRNVITINYEREVFIDKRKQKRAMNCQHKCSESSGNGIYGTAAEPGADFRGKKADCQIINTS